MTTKFKKGDHIKLRVTHGIERAQVARVHRDGVLTLDRPDGRRITAWMWDDGVAHLTAQPKCRDCGKLFRSMRGIDSHKHACPKIPLPRALRLASEGKLKVEKSVSPPLPAMLRQEEIRVREQRQLDEEVARLERALGEPIEAAERGPHRSFKMRGPGDMAGQWYLLIGATYDPRDGLQVILRRMEDKLCRIVHFSWLLPEPEVKQP